MHRPGTPGVRREPGLNEGNASGNEVPGHTADRLRQVLDRSHVADRTEQAGYDIESPAEVEIDHITVMKGDKGIALSSNGQQLF